MAIVETKTLVRPNTSVEFNPTFTSEIDTLNTNLEAPFLANSSLTSTSTMSSDELSLVTTTTYTNFDVFNEYTQMFERTLLGNGAVLGLTVFIMRYQHLKDNYITQTITRNFNT